MNEQEKDYSNPSRWKPGQCGNPKGRPKGTKNKWNKAQKDFMRKVTEHFHTNFSKMISDIDKLQPKDRVAAYVALSKIAKEYHRKEDVDVVKSKTSLKVTVKYVDAPKNETEDLEITDYEITNTIPMNVEKLEERRR